jgi:hypothetical protein
VAKPQQPELHRGGLTPADPGSVKARREVPTERATDEVGRGPVPEANRPGHHPDVEQDKPVERFVRRAAEVAREPVSAGDSIPPQLEVAPGPARMAPIEAMLAPLAAWDAIRRPDSAWEEIGESKLSWLARIVAVPAFGAWQYSRQVKPRLEAAAAALPLRGA